MALWHSQKELGGRPWRGWRTTLTGRRTPDTRKTSLAGDPGGDGGRPWRGRRFGTRNKSAWRPWRGRRTALADGALALAKKLTGTADDRLQTLVKRAWQVTLAGTADDPDGDGGRHTRKIKRAWPANLAGTADDPGGDTLAKSAWRATLAGTADDPGGDGALALANPCRGFGDGGRP